VAEHDGQPDVAGLERPEALQHRAQPSGTAICDTSVMNSGLFVSPVPCRPPVKVSALMKKPETPR
jgi:hypothetical protein